LGAPMLARALEAQQGSTAGPATKGPAYKQASEEVLSIRAILTQWQDAALQAAALSDAATSIRAHSELAPALARVAGLRAKVQGMQKKAEEPDPDLQTYGAAMKAKVLALVADFTALASDAEALQGAMEGAMARGEKLLSLSAQQREEEAAAVVAETAAGEAAAVVEDKRERAAVISAREEEVRAKAAKEEEERAEARVRMAEVDEREREAARSGGAVKAEPVKKWVDEPMTEGGEELTMEMAIALQDMADKRLKDLQAACGEVVMSNTPDATRHAAQALCAIIKNVLFTPRARAPRRIPTDNPAFVENIGSLVGGGKVMYALGFEEEEEEEEPGQERGDAPPRKLLVMNRVYLDDLRAALAFLANVK